MERHIEARLERLLGHRVRVLRLSKNLSQTALAQLASVSTETIRNLENGRGTTLRTLIKVVLSLGREEWLNALVADGLTATMGDICRLLVRKRADRTGRGRSRPNIET